jgi:hypothetical protein
LRLCASFFRQPRAADTGARVLVLLLALVWAAPAAASGEDDSRLPAAWPFAAFGLSVSLAAGGTELAGWPLDDAMLRLSAGMAAGAAPAGALLAAWGVPCAGGARRENRAACWTEAFFQTLIVAALDGGAMFATMWFVADLPPGLVRPPIGVTAGWTAGWAGGTLAALALPPLLGAPWGEDLWSTVGLFAWVHAGLAAALLGVVYALRAPAAPDDWELTLPLAAGAW